MTKLLDPATIPDELELSAHSKYLLPPEAKQALRFAWASGRPLLVLGDAGLGKTDLARAFAKAVGAQLYEYTMKSTSKAEDLLWTIDHVDRLATAQVLTPEENREQKLDLNNFTQKGPLWKALSVGARDAHEGQTQAIVLIDEIDKASYDVPNNLLDVLDKQQFRLPKGELFKRSNTEPEYMVIITSNRDKVLPAAFLRRCAVLTLKVDEVDLSTWLVHRAKAHFSNHSEADIAVFGKAAEMIKAQREVSKKYKPGTSEYLDLLRAVRSIQPDPTKQELLLAEFAPFIRKDVAA